MAELSASALFGARFRENAGRALLIPRARPGKRTPLWQQRLKSQSLLEVAKKYGEFPIVLETYRECLRDVLDVPGPGRAADDAAPPRDLADRGRDADRVAVRLLAAVRLRRHLHVRGRHAQRRAARRGAVAGPRPAARAARPGGAARPDRSGRAQPGRGRPPVPVGDPRRPARAMRCTTCCGPVGDLTADRGRAARARRTSIATAMLEDLRAERRAIAIRVSGEERWIDAADAGLYRDALGVAPPGGLPGGVPGGRARRARATGQALRRHPRPVHDSTSCAPATASTPRRRCASSSATVRWCEASCAPAAPSASGAIPRCCAGCAAPRWRCCARRSSRSTQRALARFLPGWQSVDRHSAVGRGHRSAARGADSAAGAGAARRRLGARRAAPPDRRLLAGVDGSAVRQRRAGVDRRGRAGAQLRARGPVLPRGPGRCWGRRSCAAPTRARPISSSTTRSARGWRRVRASSPICWSTSTSRPRSSRRRCGISPGRARPPTMRSRRCGRRG